jgi:hypothetical protein
MHDQVVGFQNMVDCSRHRRPKSTIYHLLEKCGLAQSGEDRFNCLLPLICLKNILMNKYEG